MSDTDYADVGPYDSDPGAVIINDRRAAMVRGVTTLDADPAKAKRSIELSRATGVDPNVINTNLENFEEQTRAQMTARLLNSSDYLRRYITDDPMHSLISNDDYANLDSVSGMVSALRKTTMKSHESGILGAPGRTITSALGAAWHGFVEGTGPGPIGSWVTDDMLKNQKLSTAIAQVGVAPFEIALRLLSGGIHGITEGVRAGSEEAYKSFTGDAMGAQRFAREMAGVAEMQVTGMGPHTAKPGMGAVRARAAGSLFEAAKNEKEGTTTHLRIGANDFPMGQIEKAHGILDRGKLWLDQGEEPPPGVDPFFDKLKVEQNNADVKNLGDIVSEVQKSATRERDPDTMARFIRMHDQGNIEIDGDAVLRLYGDKRPELEDGILGFHDGVHAQLETIRTNGGDLSIPLADFVAKVDPEVFKLLKDDIRVRPGGITKNEHEAIKVYQDEFKALLEGKQPPPLPDALGEPTIGTSDATDFSGAMRLRGKTIPGEGPPTPPVVPKETITDPLPSLRATAGLEPLDAVGDRKLSMEPIPANPNAKIAIPSDRFRIKDENGMRVGWLEATPMDKGTRIYIDNISASEAQGLGPNSFGPSLIKDLVKQIKEHYPDVKEIGGFRVSGARGKADTARDVWIKIADIVDGTPKGWDFVEPMREILTGGEWRQIGETDRTVYIKPRELYTANEHALREEVEALLQRIAPTATPREGVEIRVPDRNATVSAMYLQYQHQAPIVLWSLASGEAAVGIARHEAIHHLRREGFFTPKEWFVLERAARDNGWIEAHRIDERYPKGDVALKLEESIAEAYRNWARGEKVPEAVHPIFEKLKSLIEGVRDIFRKIIGREPTWEELFQKTESGEIGGRKEHTPTDARAFREAEMADSKTPKAANDVDAKGRAQAGTYQAAVKAQTIDRYVDENTKRGDIDYWRKIAADEGHAVEHLPNRPNAFVAARVHSEGGKTTMVIGYDGRRTVFHDGTKVVREGRKDIPLSSADMAEGPAQPELPGVTRMEDRDLFRTPGTIGMNAKQAALYERRIREMHESDVKWSKEQVEKQQRKEQTAEWKQAKKETKAEVEADFDARPDVAADIFFARGELYGNKLPEKYKIHFDDLTPEEKAQLPKDYVAKKGENGVELDDVASLVGYPSGRAMLNDLIAYNRTKLAANMGAKAFRNRMVDLEVDRRMKAQHGDLETNILESAKEQVTSETQLNLIAEDVLQLGIKAKLEASINKAQLREAVSDRFEDLPLTAAKSDKFLKTSGKNALVAEIANLQEKFDMAYQAKQKQYISMLEAKEAVALEKDQKQLESKARKLSKRDVKGLDQEYQDVIQMLLWQAGMSPRRSMPEIQRSQALSGYTDLKSFVEKAADDGWAPDVAGEIMAGRVKPMEQMTVAEFREFKSAIDSLNYIGRQVEKITIEGDARDFAAYRKGVVDNIATLPYRERSTQEKGLWHRLWSIDATLVRMENLMKDLDLGKELGPLVNAIIRPMTRAKHLEYSLQEKLSKDIKDLNDRMRTTAKDWDKSLSKIVENDWFKNPETGQPFKMTRMNMINVMLNWGNKGNLKRFTHNYGSDVPGKQATKDEARVFQAQMQQWLDTHATKADWDFVQGVWDIYKGYKGEMEAVWRSTGGSQPRLIEPVQVQTPHGLYEGGYYPLVRDQFLSPREITGNGKELFDPDYPSFNTPQGHLKERTGATYYIDFRTELKHIPMRMQQVIHDIAYREPIMSSAKIIRDRQIKGAIINHYGKEYADQLEPWLKKTARGSTFDEVNQKGIDSVLRQARLNLINYALPFNYVVTLTPDVGTMNPATMMRYMRDKKGNDAIANEWSHEIPHAMYNIDRDFKEAMAKAVGEGRLDQAKAKAARWGYGPVSYASKVFRTATFIDKFNEARSKGMAEKDAAAVADTYVRERHGAVALHDLPSIMTSGEKGRMLTMFYGYFNTQYNWARTIPGHVRRGAAEGGMSEAAGRAHYAEAVNAAWGSIIVGSIFGGLVANQAKEDDTWVKRFGKAIPLQLLGMVPFAREASTLAIEGIPPRTPVGSVLQTVQGAGGDIVRAFQNKPVKSGVKHAAGIAGMVFGVPGTLQAGRTGQFLWDVHSGEQRPRDIYEWAHGLMTGEARLKRAGQR